MSDVDECVKCHKSRMGHKISFDSVGEAYVDDEVGDFVCDKCFSEYDTKRHAIETDEKLSDSEKDAKRVKAAKEVV